MGQYYYAVLREPSTGRFIIGSPHHFGEGLKLMENGVMDSLFTRVVYTMLKRKIMNLAWVGDYAKPDDLKAFGTPKKKVQKFIDVANDEVIKPRQWIEKHYDGEKISGWFGEYIIVDHTKKEFLDQKEYLEHVPNPYRAREAGEWLVDPLVTLTAIGNGKGGGDYHGTDEEYVGRWATDEIEVIPNTQEELNFLLEAGYNRIEPIFRETR